MRRTRAMPFVFLAITLMILATLPRTTEAQFPDYTVYVSPMRSSAKLGGTFTVDVKVYNVYDLYSSAVRLQWDPSILDYSAMPARTSDLFFEAYCASKGTQSFWVPKSNQTEGWVEIATGVMGDYYGADGSGTLWRVTFLVQTLTPTPITISYIKFMDHYPDIITDYFTVYSGYAAPGDINHDQVVDIFDLTVVALAWHKSLGDPGYNPNADWNNNNYIDEADLAVVARNYG